MKQGAVKFPPRDTKGRAHYREQVPNAIRMVRAALHGFTKHVKLSDDTRFMVRDFMRQRPASAETTMACLLAIIPQLSLIEQVQFWQQLAVRTSEYTVAVLGDSALSAWEHETDAQYVADKDQVHALRGIETGNVHDIDRGIASTVKYMWHAQALIGQFGAARRHHTDVKGRMLEFRGAQRA